MVFNGFLVLILLFFNSAELSDSVKVNTDNRVNKTITAYKELNKIKGTFPGYRVQIHFGNEREKAREMKTKFLKEFPESPAYESYQSPNFRIRVGNFRTRLEALKFQKTIQSIFPSSFVVTDDIVYPEP